MEKLKDINHKQEFQIELKNRFDILSNIETDIESEWEVDKEAIKATCEEKYSNRKTGCLKEHGKK